MMHRTTTILFIGLLAIPDVHPCNGQETIDADSATKAKAPSIDELLLFFPSKFPSGDWNPKDLQFQDVYFAAEDETKLHGWYCPVTNPRAVILLAHGNAGHVASRARWLRYLQTRTKVSVFIFDYRGYGRSEGTPTVERAIKDATAARAKLCELAAIKDSEMLLMGESLGGAIVVQLAANSSPRGLILQSTFSSLRDLADVPTIQNCPGWFRETNLTRLRKLSAIAARCSKVTETGIERFRSRLAKSCSGRRTNQSNSLQSNMPITTTGSPTLILNNLTDSSPVLAALGTDQRNRVRTAIAECPPHTT